MCGIFASISPENNAEIVNKEFGKIKHRGPDYSKVRKMTYNTRITKSFSTNNRESKLSSKKTSTYINLGFHRLSIIDRTEHSNQPLELNGVYLICNGEIYNYLELAQKYNFELATGSDCEIILHLYQNGLSFKDLCNELEGEFAFVLYDSNDNTLYASRDPFGVRPLFIGYMNNELYFSSEMKNLQFVYYTNKVFGSDSYIEQFKPGYFIKLDLNDMDNIRDYTLYPYHFYPMVNYEINNIKKINTNLVELLNKSVKARLMSDVPIGCFLSGGLDSSLITALAYKYNPNIHVFSIGLKNSYDLLAAKKVIKHLGIPEEQCHLIEFTIEEGFNELENVIYHLESYDTTTIRASTPQFLLSKYISENTNIKALLSGEGADELLGGYSYSKLAPNAIELLQDSKELLRDLCYFDNLRTDRVTAAFGLEVRVPFLNIDFVNYVLSLNPELKVSSDKIIEKNLIRNAFASIEPNLLPRDILMRPKEAFSDAVSSDTETWYSSLVQKHIIPKLTKEDIDKYTLIDYKNKAQTKEAVYYRKIFDKFYLGNDSIIPHYWMPKWCDTNGDPSATVLNCYSGDI